MKIVLAVLATVVLVSAGTVPLLSENKYVFNSLNYSVIRNPGSPRVIAIFVNDTAERSLDLPSDLFDLPKLDHKSSSGSNTFENTSLDGASSGGSNFDTNDLSPSPSPEPSSSAVIYEDDTFLAPLLSAGVGAGNQLMEYITAAGISRALNRTLCLPPFFFGPSKHKGISARVNGGMMWEDRYNVSSLSRFTRVASFEHCLEQCHHTLDTNVYLRPSLEPIVRGWDNYEYANESWNMNWEFLKWQSLKDISDTFDVDDLRCVGVSALFPGLRWRGAVLAVSAFLQPSLSISEAADILQTHAIGKNTPYMAVHWRFEESSCAKHSIGLCFLRCTDGSVIATGLRPHSKASLKMPMTKCRKGTQFRAIGLSKMDIVSAIEDRAANHSLSTIYMATDGWIRGTKGLALVKEVVLLLRNRGLSVIGLWNITGLPNFADGTYYDPYLTMGGRHVMNSQQIAVVEQEICVRSTVFLGSGLSTWSLAVFRNRLAKRRSEEILTKVPNAYKVDLKARDEIVIEALLKDDHAAGLQCQYTRFMRVNETAETANPTAETSADEFPDGWLDVEACEGRVGRGGHCEVGDCI